MGMRRSCTRRSAGVRFRLRLRDPPWAQHCTEDDDDGRYRDVTTTWNKQAWDVDAIAARLLADACLGFLAEQLKPAIDANYAARPGRDDTLLMGSSMGGLISIYALLAYPQVFGAAAALSTHWITMFEDNALLMEGGCGARSPAGLLLRDPGSRARQTPWPGRRPLGPDRHARRGHRVRQPLGPDQRGRRLEVFALLPAAELDLRRWVAVAMQQQ